MIGNLENTARPEQPMGSKKLVQPEFMLSYGVEYGMALDTMS